MRRHPEDNPRKSTGAAKGTKGKRNKGRGDLSGNTENDLLGPVLAWGPGAQLNGWSNKQILFNLEQKQKTMRKTASL